MTNITAVIVLCGVILVGVRITKGYQQDNLRAQYIVKYCTPTDMYYKDKIGVLKRVIKCKIPREDAKL